MGKVEVVKEDTLEDESVFVASTDVQVAKHHRKTRTKEVHKGGSVAIHNEGHHKLKC